MKNSKFKVLAPFVCAAIVFTACPLTTKEDVSMEETSIIQEESSNNETVDKNYLSVYVPDINLLNRNPNKETEAEIEETTYTTEEETTISETTTIEEETAASEEITTTQPIVEETTTIIETTTQPIIETTTTMVETTTTQAAITVPSGQYPVTEYVWNYLRAAGYSPASTAGIIGNMMAECGGWSLNLNPYSWNSSNTCYGLCQWKTCYASLEMPNSSIEYQMAYLISNFPYVIEQSYNGAKVSMSIDMFKNLGDPAGAADVFCRGYEQCGNYEVECARRGQFAWTAYNYFMGINN